MPFVLPQIARDVVLLVVRVVAGVVLLAHGLQKVGDGQAAVTQGFEQMGVPAPGLSAFFATWVETIGGALLVVGLALPVAAALLVLDMVGAALVVHAANGVFVDQGGWELVGALGAVCLALVVTGAGRLSVDGLLARRAGRAAEPAPVA